MRALRPESDSATGAQVSMKYVGVQPAPAPKFEIED